MPHCHLRIHQSAPVNILLNGMVGSTEMYPGFQKVGIFGPLPSEFKGPSKILGVQLVNIHTFMINIHERH